MGVSKVYSCDLCMHDWPRGEMMRLGVRCPDDRPEDADYVYVGPCCYDRPVGDVLKIGKAMREAVVNG